MSIILELYYITGLLCISCVRGRCDTGSMPTPEDLRLLGELLRERREELGLRKSDVARGVGVTPAYVTLIESATPRRQGRGNPTQPGREVLVAWARVLGFDADDTARILSVARPVMMSQSLVESDQMYSARSFDSSPWPPRRDLLLTQVLELLRLAEHSSQRDEVADLMAAVFELITFRLRHDDEA